MDGHSRDERMMRLAIEQARASLAARDFPCGCVLARGDAVLAAGRNRVYSRHDALAHAEISTLQQVMGDRTHADVGAPQGIVAYVTLEPCLMCAGALLEAGVEEVVFGCAESPSTEQAIAERRGVDPIGWRGGVMEDECRALLEAWSSLRGESLSADERALQERGLKPSHLATWRRFFPDG